MEVELFNPLDPQTLEDPYPVYRILRERDPVHWHPELGAWVVSTYRDCVSVVRDPAHFTSDWRMGPDPFPSVLMSLQTLDPPEVTELRRFLWDAKRAQDMEGLEAETIAFVGRTLDGLAQESFDAVTELAAPLALNTVIHLMGLPRHPAQRLAELARTVFASTDYALDPDAAKAGTIARTEASELVSECLAAPPGGGLLAHIAATSSDVELPRDLVVNSVRAIFYGGYGSPLNFLGNAILALLQHEGSLARLRDDPRLIAPAVEELLRYEGPAQAESRICKEDTKLRDRRIAKGDIVTVLLGAANHDPEQFPDPDDLILDRSPNKHIAFGAGSHACYGSDVAVMQARVAVSALAGRFPGSRLAGTPVRARHATVRRLETLPVRLAS